MTSNDTSRPARGTLRVGVVGTGIMGKANAATIASHPAVQVTALTNRTQSTAEELADRLHADGHDRPTVYPGLDELLAAGVVDALVIATPDHLHADAMVAGAAAGVDMLVEKPFTTDTEQADRAVAAIRAAGVVAMCLFNHRWVPAYAQAFAMSADLGDAVVGNTRKNDTLFVPTEMISWAAGTTCAWFLSSHDIDLVSWLFRDTVTEVFATERRGVLRSKGVDTPDAMQIQCRFSRGAVATFESCWIYPDTFPTMTDSFVEAVFEKGVVQLDRQVENITIATESAFQYPRNVLQRNLHGQPSGAYRDAVFHFVDCALTGTEPLITVDSSRHVTAVLAAAHESAKLGVPVPVAKAP